MMPIDSADPPATAASLDLSYRTSIVLVESIKLPVFYESFLYKYLISQRHQNLNRSPGNVLYHMLLVS